MICVSIAHMSQIELAARSGADLMELRLDLINEDPGVVFPLLGKGMRTIVTCRPGTLPEEERIRWLVRSMELGAALVDIEMDSSEPFRVELTEHAKKAGSGIILSYHNFDLTPERGELVRILHRAFAAGGDIAKIATMVHSKEDTRNLISLYDQPGRKVVIGMGHEGRITRVLAPYLGAEFTFASLGSGLDTAPGQLNINQLNDIYKVMDQS